MQNSYGNPEEFAEQNSCGNPENFAEQNSYGNPENFAEQSKSCVGESLEYAGFWVRLAAYVIDSVVVFAGLLIVRLIFAGISLAGGGAIRGTDILFHYSLKDIVLYALKVLYFIAFTYLTGTTLGKKAMNLRIVSKDPAGKLTLLNVVYRETVGRFLCSLPVNIGYIVAGIDSEKRGFHDMLCDTRVVYQKKIKVWMVQPEAKGNHIQQPETGSVEGGKPDVQEQKLLTSDDKLVEMQEKVSSKYRTKELRKTENIQNSVVEKQREPVYNGYHLVESKPEREPDLNATVNENASEKDT